MSLKLAFCLFAYRPFGGLQRDFLRIASACREMGHEIHVFTMEWQGEIPEGFHVNVSPVRWRSNHARSRKFAEDFGRWVQGKDFHCCIGFNRVPGIDVYYAADPCYVAKVKRLRSPLFRLSARYRHFVEMERRIFTPQAVTRILMLTESEKKIFIRHYDTQEDRLLVLDPGISDDRRVPENRRQVRQELRREFGISESGYVLLFVGSGFKTKGLDRVLYGLADLPKELVSRTQLLVVGEDNKSYFLRLARRLGVASNVEFLGGRDDVMRFYQGADLLVHPAYSENTGGVILEAIISGLPVLTTDTCGHSIYVDQSGAGRVVASPFDQQNLNDAMRDMLESPQRSQWRENGLRFGQMHDFYHLPAQAAQFIVDTAREKMKADKEA